TSVWSAVVSTSARSTSRETPCQRVSSLDQVVTQWMSTVGVSYGSAVSSVQLQRCTRPVSVVTVNSQRSSGTTGVGPADRTGKSSVRYWPGGSRASSPRRLPRKPRETMPMATSEWNLDYFPLCPRCPPKEGEVRWGGGEILAEEAANAVTGRLTRPGQDAGGPAKTPAPVNSAGSGRPPRR